MGDMLDWAKREVEIACKKKIQTEKKENLIMAVLVMKAH
jgi:hypothetical protein